MNIELSRDQATQLIGALQDHRTMLGFVDTLFSRQANTAAAHKFDLDMILHLQQAVQSDIEAERAKQAKEAKKE